MMEQTVKGRVVSFRVDDEEWNLLESAASASGAGVRDWCRNLALETAGRERGLTKNERLLYEELGRVRYLVGHGFRLLAHENLTTEEWENTRAAAEHNAAKIADTMLARSRTYNQT